MWGKQLETLPEWGGLGDSLKIKFVFFNGTPAHFVHFGNKIIPAKYEKNSKSLGGATGQ